MTYQPTLYVRDDDEWERVVLAEVLVPDAPNVYNDYWTRKEIVEAAYAFMKRGFIIDVNHDGEDVRDRGIYVVESFIARAGDPTFVEGSWVVGMRVEDDDLWSQILSGEINGYSYEALVSTITAVLEYEDDNYRTGTTEPDVTDGHTHTFAIWVNDDNRPIAGGTSENGGHSHTITSHTVTDESEGHVHRYTILMEVLKDE